jgi:hypothetical protein
VRATYFGWSAIATIALALDYESLDSMNMYVQAVADLKRCVARSHHAAESPARPLPRPAALFAFVENRPPAGNMLRSCKPDQL